MSSKDFDIKSLLSSRSRAAARQQDKKQIPGQITIQEYMEWREDIRNRLQETKENFIVIGYRLKQLRDTEAYKQMGYSSITEMAQKEYGLNPTATSRFVKINDKYSVGGNSMELDPRYESYSYSVLCEMLTMTEEEAEKITLDMTVQEVREQKKEWREMQESKEHLEAEPENLVIIDGEYREITEEQEGSRKEERQVQFATSQMKDESKDDWKEEREETKPVELPKKDAVYRVEIGKTFFQEVAEGKTPYLILKKKHPYREGNTIILQERDKGEDTGKKLAIQIACMTDDSGGVVPGYCVIGFFGTREVEE